MALALEADRARAQAARQGLWFNPEVFLSREKSAGVTDQFFLVGQTFPIHGRTGLDRDAADAGAEAAVQRSQLRRLVLRAQVRTAFFDLLLAQETSSAYVEGWERMRELVRVLRVREEAGESSGFDRMRAERELAEVEADGLDAMRKEDLARLVLGGLLATPESDELQAVGDLTRKEPMPPLEDLLPKAETRGDVAAYQQERRSAELQARSASRRAIPEPRLEIGVKKTDLADSALTDSGATFSLTIPIPIFNRGQRDAALAEAETILATSRYEAQLRLARAEIEAAYKDATRRREAEERYRQLADPEELHQAAQVAYDEGEQGILELLDAYRVSLNVKKRGLELAAETLKARIALDRAAGEEVIP
jgi:cobalt-zinc-cadmium efflux system outer membrane protein